MNYINGLYLPFAPCRESHPLKNFFRMEFVHDKFGKWKYFTQLNQIDKYE